ncbi:conserved protein of unknown function [Ralstonia solanacearum CMR15]|nr:conserved protein of unknown function [Ralstonia solanacearum CMR15]
MTEAMRPRPPDFLLAPENWIHHYAPAKDLAGWVQSQIIEEGPLHNEEHVHLLHADVAFLWAAERYEKQGRHVLGQTEEVAFRVGRWQRGRQEQQLKEWFGRVPDWLITLDAEYCANCSDAEFCALVEHELYHIGQEKGDFGAPAFTRDGLPKLFLRSHDVEEFIGVVRRYGVGDPNGALAQLVSAANSTPQVRALNVSMACGTCLARAA